MTFLSLYSSGFVLKFYGIYTKFPKLWLPSCKAAYSYSISLYPVKSLGIWTPILKFSPISGVHFTFSSKNLGVSLSHVGFFHVPDDSSV